MEVPIILGFSIDHRGSYVRELLKQLLIVELIRRRSTEPHLWSGGSWRNARGF